MTIQNRLVTTMDRVRQALQELCDMNTQDLQTVRYFINQYIQKYNGNYLDSITQYLYTVDKRLEDFKHQEQLLIVANSTGNFYYDRTDLSSLITAAKTFNLTLRQLQNIKENQEKLPSLQETWTAKEYANCSSVTSTFNQSVTLLEDSMNQNNMPDMLNQLSLIIVDIPEVSSCILAYTSALDNMTTTINKVIEDISLYNKTLKTAELNTLDKEMEMLMGNRSLFLTLQQNYSKFEITKLDLQEYINETTVKSMYVLLKHIILKARTEGDSVIILP